MSQEGIQNAESKEKPLSTLDEFSNWLASLTETHKEALKKPKGEKPGELLHLTRSITQELRNEIQDAIKQKILIPGYTVLETSIPRGYRPNVHLSEEGGSHVVVEVVKKKRRFRLL